jgi:TolB-like protein/Tfp pilus assembly protein PilF
MVLPRFLAELKHRKVYRAAVVYAAVGWALLEAADVVLPRLGFPDWTVNVVLAVVLLCFPLAIVFAWIFDLSPQGIVRTEPMSPEARHHFSITSIVEFAVICILVVTVGYLYLDRLSLQKGMVELESAVKEKPEPSQPAVPNPEQYRAIAVLPFADMSEARDQDWFAEGVAEELLLALSQVEELKVTARTSSFAFKDTDKTIAEIADVLGVQAVLEGSVRRSGDLVRVTAQLIDTSSGYHIWSGSYERDLNDIFQLQDELAKSIVRALRVELGFAHNERLVDEQTEEIEAYNFFIKGRALFDWANAKTHLKSIQYLERAVEADPEYTLAWGYLASAQSLSILWRPIDSVYPSARAAYERALDLDPDQSQALDAKALMILIHERDWTVAGKLYQRALASRDNTSALTGYGVFILPAVDKLDESVRLYSEAEKRDPLHAGFKANLAILMLYSGDAKASIQKALEALELQPDHLFAYMALIEAYTQDKQYSQAKITIESVPPKLKNHHSIMARTGIYYAAVGDHEKARDIYRQIVDSSPAVPVAISSSLALALGDVEGAIDLMELVVQKRGFSIPWLRGIFRHNELLEDHPRYLALLESIGLDDASVSVLQAELGLE